MKRAIEILLIIVLLLPMIHDLQSVEDVCIVADGGQYLDEPTDGAEWQAPPKTLSQTILLKATTLRRFSIVRVKCLRLLRQKPIIKSESGRRSEMRSGDVSTMRI
jgi:hypothetical protein